MTTALFLALIIFIFSIWYLTAPFVAKMADSECDSDSGRRDALLLHKEEILLTLDELELDHRLQKISAQEYEQLRAEALQEGAGVLRKISESETVVRKEPSASARFCHHCGAALLEASRFCSHCGTKLNTTLAVLSLLLPFLLSLWAQPVSAQMPEHVMPEVKRGELHGEIYQRTAQGEKKFLVGQNVGLMVFNKGVRVLILEKNSDEQGKFIFKNIFQDPNYSYSLGSIIEGQLYVLTELQLLEGQKQLDVDFQVGPGSPNAKGPVAELMAEAEQLEQAAPVPVPSQPPAKGFEAFQKITLVLSGLVLLMALLILARGSQRP